MNADAAILSVICALCVGIVSLVSSHLYRKEEAVGTVLMSLVSFVPGFLYAAVAVVLFPGSVRAELLAAIFVKNILYSFSFYYRYESLRVFGPFVGALMLGTQPILVFALGVISLGEYLNMVQIFSVALASAALLFLTGKGQQNISRASFSRLEFWKYFLLPTIFSALVIIWDRQFLRGGEMSGDEFFVVDRILVLPAFFLALVLIKRRGFWAELSRDLAAPILRRNWRLLATIGLVFTLSVYAYNLALELEKAALVSLVRNAAYPAAAFVGAFLFTQEISLKKWLSLVFVVSAVVLAAMA